MSFRAKCELRAARISERPARLRNRLRSCPFCLCQRASQSGPFAYASPPALTPCKRQRYYCLMLPPLDRVTGNLPPGVHEVSWSEIVGRFGYTPHRLALLSGLKAALDVLCQAGCQRAYLDGSFVTAKQAPNDFDACWEMNGVDFDRLEQLEPVLLDWRNRRAAQKARFGGELFIAESAADPWGTTYLDFFQRDRDTAAEKGIVALALGELP